LKSKYWALEISGWTLMVLGETLWTLTIGFAVQIPEIIATAIDEVQVLVRVKNYFQIDIK